MSLSLNFRKAVLTTITAGNPSYLLETTANSSSGIRISQRYEKKDRCCRCPKIRETSSVFLWFLLQVSAKMGHLQHQGVSVTTNERTSANGGGRSAAGKVQFYAGDLARFSASQALPVGKVSPLKLDLTRNLQRPFPKRSKQCIHEPSGEPPVPV